MFGFESGKYEIGQLQLLEQAILNEMFSPEILPSESSAFEDIIGAIRDQTDKLEMNENLHGLFRTIMETDLERARHLLRSYIETRLGKIDSMILYLSLKVPETSSLLFAFEHDHVKRVKNAIEIHYGGSICSKLPTSLVGSCEEELLIQPMISGHAIVQIISDIGDLMVDEVILLKVKCRAGDIFRFPYSIARELVLQGKARFL